MTDQIPRPTKKAHLMRYYEALHWALEREFQGFPDNRRVSDMRHECMILEERVLRVPGGPKLVNDARWNALNADASLFSEWYR